MTKKKDFSTMGKDAVSKFFSPSVPDEPMVGQLTVSVETQSNIPINSAEQFDTKQNTQYTNKDISTLNTYNKQYTHNTLNDDNHVVENITSKENKSKRLNLLIQPSLQEDMSKIAHMSKLSLNELIARVLKGYVEQEPQQTKLKKYDEFFS